MSEKGLYEVKVGFRRSPLVKDNSIIIGVKSTPEKDKANLEITKRLAKYFSIHESVRIIKGFASRKKLIAVAV